jgi:hypothetical protein
MRKALIVLAAGTLLVIRLGDVAAFADAIPAGWQASNMAPVGYAGLEGRQGFKLVIRQIAGRWYLYSARFGIEILDVTDPTDPKQLKYLPGPPNTAVNQITVHDNLMVTGLSRPITPEEGSGRADGWTTLHIPAPADKPYQEGVLIWDVSDPTNPRQLSQWEGHASGTHRNVYPGGRYAYLSATVPGFRGFILVILDVSDPVHPKEAGRWWYPGQKADEQPGEVTPSFHGPVHVSPDGKMLTAGYTPSIINLDITDIAHPKPIGRLTLIPPFANTLTQSIHTVVPLWDRQMLYVNSESMKSNCNEPAQFAGLVDNKDPAKPWLISLFPVPVPPANAPFKDFCEKGGRFGPHNVNTEIHHPDVEKPGNLIYLTYFNAGLRVFNIKNPRLPVESGWFNPPNPTQPVRAQGGMLTVNQTQDVLVDTRGYIYITDSAWGIWILRYTGPDQPVPTSR